jgi:hypothetical protein
VKSLLEPRCHAALGVNTVDGERGGAVVMEVECVEVELSQVTTVVDCLEAQGHAHEPHELLHPLPNLVHHTLHGGDDVV